jgi:hypothetical protein
MGIYVVGPMAFKDGKVDITKVLKYWPILRRGGELVLLLLLKF